jgi:hypothetical protein
MAHNSPDTEEESHEAGSFFQKPKFDAFERLICSHLIEASKNEPLQTVIHITRAALAINDETRAKLGINKELMRSLYTVSQRLQGVAIIKRREEPARYSVNLRTCDYERDIRPWNQMIGYEHSFDQYSGIAEKLNQLYKENKMTYFNESNRILTISGYSHMVSDFLLYAIPIIEEATRKLATLVSPETYTELMKIYQGEKPQT